MKQFYLNMIAAVNSASSTLYIFQAVELFRSGVLSSIAERAGLFHTDYGLIFPALFFIGILINFISIYYTFHSRVTIAMYIGIIGLIISCTIFIYFSIFYYIMFALWVFLINLFLLQNLFVCMIFLILSKYLHFTTEEFLTKEEILHISTKLIKYRKIQAEIKDKKKIEPKRERYAVRQIAGICKIDEDSLIYFIKQLIDNKEINGAYFKSTRTLVFKHEADMMRFNYLMGGS